MTTAIGRLHNGVAPFRQFLTQAGDGSGAISAVGNYSGGATDWVIRPTAGETLRVISLAITLADAGKAKVDDYGFITGGLTNGVDILVALGEAPFSILAGNKPKTNAALMAIGASALNTTDDDTYVQVVLGFTQEYAGGLILRGADDRLIVRLNDNFTGLKIHQFLAAGAIGE